MKRVVASLICLLIFALSVRSDEVDFNRDIRPILSNKCFRCHGPDDAARQAGLRLDSFKDATDYAVVPGDAEGSEVVLRITADDEDLRMPPAGHGLELTDAEILLVRRWIDSGAKFDLHWSYNKPVRPEIKTFDSDWIQNNIDRLTYPVMRQRGLMPAPQADRNTLARRVAFDLTGLPPTIDEVDRFINDKSPNAYEKMVDQMLAKSAYGERWAAVWLDHARYADSAGFAEDHSRTIWAFRDYVIRSFNQNKPFDQFTIEQLAGDLLTEPTEEQIIATAFHRNTLTNSEGGTIDEEFRSAAIVDRTNTTMAVWMGTTIACAQCHTHKYDPITQHEYFQLYAFFNNTADNDHADERPIWNIFSDAQKAKRTAIADKIARLRSELVKWEEPSAAQRELQINKRQNEWERETANRIANQTIKNTRFVRLEIPKGNSILSLAEVQVFADGENVALNGTAKQSSTAYEGPAKLAIDGNTDGKFDKSRSVTHTATENNPWWEIEFEQNYPIDQIVIWNRTDGNLHSRLNGLVVTMLDENRAPVWSRDFPKTSTDPITTTTAIVPDDIQNLIAKKIRSDDEIQKLRKYFLIHHGPTVELQTKIWAANREYENFKPTTTVPVMRELSPKAHRKTHVHVRGNYLDQGEAVTTQTPAIFHSRSTDHPNRLALAKWLVDPENPLTARVTVNRLWQQLFGMGIVSTSEDFGSQGELPSHPKLLDYLACEFMENGWDIKYVLKQIVMSATYRQSSRSGAEKTKLDPNNRWLARGPSFRLSAEMIRDQALACSGLLSETMFGPPVQPPQPKTGLKFAFSNKTADWVDSTGDDRYRRAIYTRWRRTSPYPSMATFDISNREVCELRRLQTNTPLQALVTLNDPVYIEAAQGLARQSLRQKTSIRSKLTHAFRSVLIRPPNELELSALTELYEESKSHFSDNEVAAEKFAVDRLNPPKPDTDLVELAAWTTVANVLLNLDEALVKR